MRTLVTVLVAAAALATAAVPALADPKTEAEALFRAGEKAFDAGQYQAAADAFDLAYKKLPLPAIAFSEAQAYRLQYFISKQPAHLRRAVELYHRYIDAQKHGGRVSDAASNLAQLEPLLQQMQAAGTNTSAPAQVRTTRLMIMADVDGATGQIDGKAGPMPLVAEVSAGEHTVEVTADGYYPVTMKARAVDGEMVPVDVQLKAKPALLDVRAPKGSQVTIDGRPLGTAPLRAAEVPAGHHLVTVTHRGRVPIARELDLARGKASVLDADLRTTGQRKAARWVLIGSGALAVGAGVAAGLAASSDSKAADLKAQLDMGGLAPDALDRYDQLRAQRDDRVRVAWILGGGAVAVAATGALMYLFDDRSPEAAAGPRAEPGKRKLDIEPVVGPGTAGVRIGGSF